VYVKAVTLAACYTLRNN